MAILIAEFKFIEEIINDKKEENGLINNEKIITVETLKIRLK